MNRIVAKPNLIADDELNSKIEKIFPVEIFQKMVENADVFQDLSSTSLFNNSEFLQRSIVNQASFKKILPTSSQLAKEDHEAESPHKHLWREAARKAGEQIHKAELESFSGIREEGKTKRESQVPDPQSAPSSTTKGAKTEKPTTKGSTRTEPGKKEEAKVEQMDRIMSQQTEKMPSMI